MASYYIYRLLSLFALLLAASLVSAQLTTNNAQSACVQYGGCTTARGTQVTATQNAPVTRPGGTPALATYTTLDSAFISSLAAAGATSAYRANGGGSGGNGGTVIVTRTASSGGSGGSGSGSGSGSSSMTTLNIGGSGSSSSGASNKVLEVSALNAVVVLGGALMGAAILL